MTMDKVLKEMFKEFAFNEKSEETISEVNGMKLPDDYLGFISEHNGGEGPLGSASLVSFLPKQERNITLFFSVT